MPNMPKTKPKGKRSDPPLAPPKKAIVLDVVTRDGIRVEVCRGHFFREKDMGRIWLSLASLPEGGEMISIEGARDLISNLHVAIDVALGEGS